MEINFKPIELSDRDAVTEIIYASDKRFCEYTFGNMYCWAKNYGIQLCITEDTVVMGNPDKMRFNYPVGKNADAVYEEISRLYPLCTFSCLDTKEADGKTDDEMKVRFDYIYESNKLATLTGKKLAAKRNHINAFVADGEWYTKEIEKSDIPSLRKFNKKWCAGLCDSDESLKAEMCAVECGLNNFDALGYRGLMLYKNGNLCAYCYGERINRDTFCVHVEKADSYIRGAYQMINREFAKTLCDEFRYINREDDAGDEGLRRAKLSYYPLDLGKKFILRRK